MTWVIGVPSMFGYSFGLADVQATIEYQNGKKEYVDAVVQKIFPIAKFIAAGYSGSIEVGFYLIEDLQKWAFLPDSKTAWIPDCLVLKWHRRARWLFSRLNKQKQQYTEIILIGVYPQKGNGIPGQAQTYCCIMRSPKFIPEIISAGKIGSIGSGNGVDSYMKILNEINTRGYSPLMQMEVQNPGGYGNALSTLITIKVRENPTPGISKHLHICVVRRGSIKITSSDYSVTDKNGRVEEVKMPKVANNWNEFQSIMNKKGIKLANAIAIG